MEQSRRELNKINCRKRILRASRRLFSVRGYEDTMIEDIARRAGVSKATVYNYFPNKESLLTGTADEVIERVCELVKTDLADCSNSEQKLRRVLGEFVKASVDYLGLSRRIVYLNSCEESALYATSGEMLGILRELILAAQDEGVFRSEADPDEMVDLLMGLYLITQFQWPQIGRYTPEFLHEKLNRYFSAIMSRYYR